MDIITLILMGMAFVIFMLLCGYVLCYVMLKPVIPYLVAKLKKKDLLFLIGKDNKIKLIPANYSSGVFDSQSPPFSFIQRTPKTYRLGDRNSVIVIDEWGVVLDPDMSEALEVLYDRGITNYKQLEKALNAKDANGDTELENSDLIKINAFRTVTVGNILNYTGDVASSEIRAHMDEDKIEFLANYSNLLPTKKGGTSTMMLMMIVAVVAAIGGYILMSSGGMKFF